MRITENRMIMTKMLKEIVSEWKIIGLKINQEKPKIITFIIKFENRKITVDV